MKDEKVIETKICKHCSNKFDITDKDLEFYEKVSPSFWWEKYLIPTPTLCPDCRMQRKLSFRNEINLYRRNCDLTGKSIISIYSPDKSCIVYDQKEWWGDKWDAIDYSRMSGIDFNLTFFENFSQLDRKVPKLSVWIQNCDYTNDTWDSKNCYMSFRTHYSENIIYSYRWNRSTNCVDCYQVKESENLYECFECDRCQNSKYLYRCNNSHSSIFLYNCIGCSDCILCYNLNNNQYFFLNKQYSKEEYKKIEAEIKTNQKKFEEAKQKFFSLIKNEIIHKNLNNHNSENCIWNELINCSNCFETYMMKWCENSKYAWDNVSYKNSMDNYSWWTSEYVYETTASKTWYKIAFTLRTRECEDVYYSHFLFNCNNCFWCIWLRNKSYCILNKQYSKEEYEILIPKIIEHMVKTWEWGEFFPSSLSPFGYNETVANEYFPLSREKILSPESFSESGLKMGSIFNWSYYGAPFPKVEKIIPASKLPENISEIPDDILNWAIECETTKKPFRIIPQELEFYRKHNLPIPKIHPDQRHLDRMKLRNPRKLFTRICEKCKKEIQTTYAPERPEIVYCQECYEKEIY